jgi:hypothetical protein
LNKLEQEKHKKFKSYKERYGVVDKEEKKKTGAKKATGGMSSGNGADTGREEKRKT